VSDRGNGTGGSKMSHSRTNERSPRFRVIWCALVSAICLASVLGGMLAEGRWDSLRLAAAGARQEAA
jgi:hypothetical protein